MMRWAGASKVRVRCRPSVMVSGKAAAVGARVAASWVVLTAGAGRVGCAVGLAQAARNTVTNRAERVLNFMASLLTSKLNKKPCTWQGGTGRTRFWLFL